MEDSGVRLLYEPYPTPSLYVGLVTDILGRAPLMPCFMAGNSTLTIPSCFARHKQSAFPFGLADTDGSSGSNVYEVNLWMWQFGRRGLEAEMWLRQNEDGRRVWSNGKSSHGRPENGGRRKGGLVLGENKIQCALFIH